MIQTPTCIHSPCHGTLTVLGIDESGSVRTVPLQTGRRRRNVAAATARNHESRQSVQCQMLLSTLSSLQPRGFVLKMPALLQPVPVEPLSLLHIRPPVRATILRAAIVT